MTYDSGIRRILTITHSHPRVSATHISVQVWSSTESLNHNSLCHSSQHRKLQDPVPGHTPAPGRNPAPGRTQRCAYPALRTGGERGVRGAPPPENFFWVSFFRQKRTRAPEREREREREREERKDAIISYTHSHELESEKDGTLQNCFLKGNM